MIFEDKTLNNIVNFSSSYLLNSTLKSEELVNEFSVFAYKMSRNELMMNIGETLAVVKGTPISNELIVTRLFLANKFEEFLNLKQIEHNVALEISILKNDEIKSISQIQREYTIGFNRACKIFDLYKSLM
jgi:hypothetical protein